MIKKIGQQGVMPKQKWLEGSQQKAQDVETGNRGHKSEARVTKTDMYLRVSQTDAKVTYDRPKGADMETIQRLKEESDQAYSRLKGIVRQLLERQGLSFQDILGIDPDDAHTVEVDDQAVQEAQALIGEGGALSPEVVSDRIVKMAMAFAGDDQEKMALMRSAIEEGFRAAEDLFGGQLPDISSTTYDLIQEKLDAWEQQGQEA